MGQGLEMSYTGGKHSPTPPPAWLEWAGMATLADTTQCSMLLAIIQEQQARDGAS